MSAFLDWLAGRYHAAIVAKVIASRLIELDAYGERLCGCVGCNNWQTLDSGRRMSLGKSTVGPYGQERADSRDADYRPDGKVRAGEETAAEAVPNQKVEDDDI